MVGEDNKNDDQGANNEVYQENECVGGNIAFVKNSTMLRRDDSTIPIDELYVQLDANMFIGDNPSIEGHNTNSNNALQLRGTILTPIIKKSEVATMIQNLNTKRTLNMNNHPQVTMIQTMIHNDKLRIGLTYYMKICY